MDRSDRAAPPTLVFVTRTGVTSTSTPMTQTSKHRTWHIGVGGGAGAKVEALIIVANGAAVLPMSKPAKQAKHTHAQKGDRVR